MGYIYGLNATLCVCSQHVRAGLHPVPEPRARLPAEAALQGHGCVFAVAFSRIDVALLRLTVAAAVVVFALVRNVAYRSRVAHEILDTESFYVKSMNQCITVWLNPLNEAIASGSPLINAADVRAIFSDIALLYTFNSELYSEIESRVAKWGTYECLGDIFLRLVRSFSSCAVVRVRWCVCGGACAIMSNDVVLSRNRWTTSKSTRPMYRTSTPRWR